MDDLGTVDVLVVGGGINGVGIARDAVGRGLSVVMCEKDDLAEGTSSRSGKLVHGGLRYLEYYEFRLVREALTEREVLLDAAPHIIWPMRFVLPHSSEQRPAWLVRLGLFLYDHLGGRKTLPGTRTLDLRTAPEGAAIKDKYTKAFEYSDCWVDDARLVVLNAVDARERGGTILTRTAAASLTREGERWNVVLKRQDNTEITVKARAVVNAAGPWVENIIRNVARQNSARRVRLVKGSHLVVKKFWNTPNAFLFQNTDKRVIFVNPYQGDLCLIGTTDIAYDGDASDVSIEDREIDYLLSAVNRYTCKQLAREDILHSFSGVRPLLEDDAENPSAVTRDYVFDLDGNEGEAPILNIFGGKITTYRELAEHALDKLGGHFPKMGKAWTGRVPLPGGDMPNADFDAFLNEAARRYPFLPDELTQHYARLYGTRIERIVGSATSLVDLGRHFGATFYEAEARYLIDEEWAVTPADILDRRTKHGLSLNAAQKATLVEWMATKSH